MASNIASVPLGTIWTDSSNLPCPVGTVYDDGAGKTYAFVKFLDAVTYAVGQVTTYANAAGTSVTNDISGGSSIGAIFGGICLAIQTQNSWGWVQRTGHYATAKTSGADDIAIGENVFVHGSTDGTCDGTAATAVTTTAIGICVTADVDADNTVAVLLK